MEISTRLPELLATMLSLPPHVAVEAYGSLSLPPSVGKRVLPVQRPKVMSLLKTGESKASAIARVLQGRMLSRSGGSMPQLVLSRVPNSA